MAQISIFDMLLEPVRINKPIRLIELFSGYGSQAMALERMGVDFEHYKAVDFDEPAIRSYNVVHGTNFPVIDVCDVHGKDLEIRERESYSYILVYSFPCTDISIAGQQKGMAEDSGTRSALLWEVRRILEELNEEGTMPDVLLMENVTAIHSDENRPHLKKWLEFLESIGYTSYMADLNGSDYGVPQNRDRCFVVSTYGEYSYQFPDAIELTRCMEDYFEDLDEEQALKLVVKSQKALDLLVTLDEEGKLE